MSRIVERIRNEFKDLERDEECGTSIIVDPLNPWHFTGTMKGPYDTPYAGGTFEVDIILTENYPLSPPKMKFNTKVWHPNVSSLTGAISLTILKDQWCPALTMKTTMISLQALLSSPNHDLPLDAVVAMMYKKNQEEFEQTAKFWTENYAKPSTESTPALMHPTVRKLVDMGFSEEACMNVLMDCCGDEYAAVEVLLSSI